MTETTDDERLSVELPETGTGARAEHRALRRHARRTQQAWLASAMVVLAAAIPVLGYVGYRSIITTREGRRVAAENDPSKANYEANVVPTPVLLLTQTDGSNLVGVTIVSLGPRDTGGAALFVPVTTVTDDVVSLPSPLDSPSTTTSTTKPGSVPKKISLKDGYLSAGLDGLTQYTANVVGLSFESVVSVDEAQLAQYVAPSAPLTIDNPDRLVEVDANGKASVAFPAGNITLQAADVPRYLTLRNPKESDLARLAREEAVWRAWLAAIKSSSNPNVVPGETTVGLGRYLRGLAKGDVKFATLPASASTAANGDEIFVPDTAGTAALMSTLVPLPTPANPGDRVRVRLLSGVGPADTAALLATRLVPPTAQLTIVGNADRFDYAETQIVYYDDGFASAAAALQSQLGVGQVTKRTTEADSEDITLIIGRDLVDKQGLKITQGSN